MERNQSDSNESVISYAQLNDDNDDGGDVDDGDYDDDKILHLSE